jgi:hypothetical protein
VSEIMCGSCWSTSPNTKPDLRVAHVNLFDLIIDHLKERNLLDRSFQMQREKGDAALEKALRSPLKAEKLAQIFVDFVHPPSKIWCWSPAWAACGRWSAPTRC